MEKTILFIHGMFQNAVSWQPWVEYFSAKGYKCITPSWKYHDGVPAQLRSSAPVKLGQLTLQEIVDQFELECARYQNPIVIGHSVGGLVAQILAAKKVASMAVCISSVAPNNMLTIDWNFMKNAASIMNPIKGDEPFMMTEKGFHEAFANTLSPQESNRAFMKTATHDSRNVLRDCLGATGRIDLGTPHVPLLFIGGSEDHIIPAKLNAKNAEAYTDKSSVVTFKEFTNRSHFICGEHGWQEVADYACQWLEKQNQQKGGTGAQRVRSGGR